MAEGVRPTRHSDVEGVLSAGTVASFLGLTTAMTAVPESATLPGRSAVLLIAHGSRRPEANADLVRLAGMLANDPQFDIIETSYLELASPDIPTGGRKCVERGATTVRMLPYFLSAGAHVVEDLEAHRAELSQEFQIGRAHV